MKLISRLHCLPRIAALFLGVLSATPVHALDPAFSLVPVRADLSFERPLDIQFADGLAYVVEQDGKIVRFSPSSAEPTHEVLDISSLVTAPENSEQGLLGFAFHPRFQQNGLLFVNYTRKPDGATVIARFTIDQGTQRASLASERLVLLVPQPFSNHNGGSLFFGNDGFLYIALGDGGSGGDPQKNAQNRSSLLGKLLRIDVESVEAPYSVPPSNPYRGNTRGFKEEIFAYGLRNPFKTTIDRRTGKIWAGDVGQDRQEEVDIIRRGKNYGWNLVEGRLCYPQGTACAPRGLERPIVTYTRDKGRSITGGYVYRGRDVPRLSGWYIYGDFVSGTIWRVKRSGRRYVNRQILDTSYNIASFGLDAAGEVYVVSYDGALFKLGKS